MTATAICKHCRPQFGKTTIRDACLCRRWNARTENLFVWHGGCPVGRDVSTRTSGRGSRSASVRLIASNGRREGPLSNRWVYGIAIVSAFSVVAAFLSASTSDEFDTIGAVAVIPAVVLLWLTLAWQLGQRQSLPWAGRVVVLSAVAKIVASLLRYSTSILVYGGLFDAGRYHLAGNDLVGSVWRFDFDFPVGIGTRSQEVITGLVYALVGPSPLTGFLAFAFLAWVGQYLFYRAFLLWMSEHEVYRYALLVFFVPTVLFWPSSIGKESWMMLTLGATTYGLALFLHHRGGVVLTAFGLLGASLVRPHVAVIAAIAIAAAVATGSRRLRPGTRLLGLILIGTGGLLLAARLQAFFDLPTLSLEELNDFREDVQLRTATGGSEFSNVSISNPLLFPLGFISTMLRPFPWEAPNVQALIVSFEGLGLVAFAWRVRHTFRHAFTLIRSDPFVAYCAAFVILFVIGFSNFNNFGLLARERSQAFPMLLVFLCVKSPRPLTRSGDPVTVHEGSAHAMA